MGSIQFSIVVPVFNGEKSLAELVKGVCFEMDQLAGRFELVLVDDCSTDGSWKIINDLADIHSSIRAFRLVKNCGQIQATQFGLIQAKGDLLITIDDDLQHPPWNLKKMIRSFKDQNLLILFGAPIKRISGKGYRFWVGLVALLFHKIFMRSYDHVNFFTTFRVMDKSLIHPSGDKNKLKNLFFLWQIPPDKMGHLDVEFNLENRQNSRYVFVSLLSYYQPFIWYMLKKGSAILLILIIALFALFGLIRQPTTSLLLAIGSISTTLLLLIIFSLKNLKRLEKIKVDVAEILDNSSSMP